MNYVRLAVGLLLLGAVTATAQTTSGSMSGTVIDASGQVIPGATVTVVHETTGAERSGTTSAVGAFVFPALVPGPYTIRVELEGFKPLEVRGRVVLANNRLAVGELKLAVGQVTEEVSVSARGETVATTTTSHQAVIDMQQMANLSVRGRDPISLLKLLPGVQIEGDQDAFGGSFATGTPAVQGGRGQTFYVDGINGGDGGGGGNFSGATNMDAIEQVNVQMSAYTAEYGLKGGAQINFITKRGGSQYHGTAYTYQRDKALNATPFFNNRDGVPKPEYRFSNIGGTLGGPVPKLPKINPDGTKLFFFYSIDDTQSQNVQPIRRFTTPTALERRGDFSQTRRTNGSLVVVTDPLTGRPFPGNTIPFERHDPRSLAMLNLLPMPNAEGVGYNYIYQEPSIDQPRRQQLFRVDYRPTNNDTFSFKGQTWYTKSVGHNVAGASARWGLVRQRYDFTAPQAKFDYTRIFGPNTVLEFGAGIFHSTEDGPPADDAALRGLQRSTYTELAGLPQFAPRHNPLNLIPEMDLGSLQHDTETEAELSYDGRWPIFGADTAINGGLSMTHTRGTHTFKGGVMFEHERFGQARSGIFAGEFDFGNNSDNPRNTGFAYSNAFLGIVTDYQESMGRVGDNRRSNTLAWYAQDTWKVTPKLTMDYGLRMYKWDHPHQGGGEASAFSFEVFDPTWGGAPPVLFRPVRVGNQRRALNPVTGEIVPDTFIGQMVPGTGYTCGVITPDTPCQINGILLQYNDLVEGGRGFTDRVPLQFDPRFGIAYAVNPKTVFRVAGGLFHDAVSGATFDGGPAYNFTRRVRFTDMNSYLTGTGVTAPSNVSGVERGNTKLPVTYRFTVGIEREIGWNTVINAAYVGDRTQNLDQEWNYNAIPAGARFRPENRDLSQPDSSSVGLQPDKPNPGALPNEFLRPIVGFGDIDIERQTGKYWYDSLQVQLSRRFTGGLEMAGSYTWAKGFQSDLNQNNPLPSMRQRDIGIQEHVLVTSFIYDIPSVSHRLGWGPAKWLLDNWRVSGISQFATGQWSDLEDVEFEDDFDFSGGGEECGPVIMTGNPNLPRGERTFDRWFDTSVFQRPSGRGDIGNNCYNAKIQLPGWHQHDLTLFKDFPLRGNHKLQFRWEISNLFNHPQWNEVDTTAQFDEDGEQTNRNFGKVTSVRTERRMVMALRYSF